MEDKNEQNDKNRSSSENFGKHKDKSNSDTQKIFLSETGTVLADMEATVDNIAVDTPQAESGQGLQLKSFEDFKAILEVSLAINSSLILDDILQIVMKKAIEIISAQRGFIMLLDDNKLKFKAAYDINEINAMDHDIKISSSIANQVAASGQSVYISDAQSDKKYALLNEVTDLNLHSIMCVPLKIKNNIIGVIYLDNSAPSPPFLKPDLLLIELLGQQAAHAIYNATLYDHLFDIKEFNEKVVNNSPVGIISINSNYEILSINDAALRALQKNREDITCLTPEKKPTRLLALIPKAEKVKWRQMLDIALTTNQPFEDARYFYNTDYEDKVLSIRITPINNLPYGGDGLILTIEDITEKIIMEKYVILSEKLVARGEMASSIAHELNNYLAIIGNNAEILGHNLKRKMFDKASENAHQIVDNINKVKRFTDGMMDFSKLETEITPYDIQKLIDELLFSLKALTRFKKIMFTIKIEPRLPKVFVDIGQIQQVLMNLLYNSADAIEKLAADKKEAGDLSYKGKIKLEVKSGGGINQVIISIKDNGVGMSDEVKAKIFQPHFTTKDSGHGLGLANCKTIINNHKGVIKLTSKMNQGTEFKITLPTVEDVKHS
ncbi:MAG: GAF domain-containing protein [candidate division Zixibacteria bacterium]|nr:GAF domain-containing protein [candidate division Zixibacteria bacterium]